MALLAVAGTSSVYAATDLWVGNTDVNFNTASNWTGSVAPGGNAPQFGVAGSSGTTLNNDIVGASFTGFTFNSGASAFIIGGQSFALTSNGITNSSTSLQTINNNLTITNAGNITLAGGAGGLTLGGTTTNQTAATKGLFITGTVNSSGTFTESGGANNTAGYLSIGGAQTLNVTAGTFSVLGTTGTKPLSSVGQAAAGTSNLNVSGGELVIGANTGFALANASTGTGVLTISSTGLVTINRGTTETTTNTVDARMIMMGRAPTADGGNTGIINLNGGTLATDRQFVRNGSSGAPATAGIANFVFGGGTLKALGAQTDWLQSTTASLAGQGGSTLNTNALALSSVTTTAVSTIDSNGFSVAINSAISGVGGFNIISSSGNGTVIFGGTNTYTGPTTVTTGTLTLGANSASATFLADSSSLYLTTGSLLNLSFADNTVMESISGLFIDGQQQLAGTWGAQGSGALHESALITGTGLLNVSAIPEPSTYAAIAGVLALGAVIIRRRNRQA